jgi:hypothetical protein
MDPVAKGFLGHSVPLVPAALSSIDFWVLDMQSTLQRMQETPMGKVMEQKKQSYWWLYLVRSVIAVINLGYPIWALNALVQDDKIKRKTGKLMSPALKVFYGLSIPTIPVLIGTLIYYKRFTFEYKHCLSENGFPGWLRMLDFKSGHTHCQGQYNETGFNLMNDITLVLIGLGVPAYLIHRLVTDGDYAPKKTKQSRKKSNRRSRKRKNR